VQIAWADAQFGRDPVRGYTGHPFLVEQV